MRDFCISEAGPFQTPVDVPPGEGACDPKAIPDVAVPAKPSFGGGAQTCKLNPLAEDDLALIGGSDFFQQMGETELSDLLHSCRVRIFGPGRIVFRQGDEALSFFLVLEGWLKVTKLTVTGELMVRRIVKAGGTLAEAATFCDGLYPGTGESLTEARLLEVPMARVVAAMGGRQSLAFNMVIGMARQAERTAGRLEEAFHFTAPQRLAAFLIGLFPDSTARISTRLPYDKCLLALSLGMTPETLSRAFLALRALGVQTRNREIFVEDVQVLRRFCRLDD